ncbi:MAG: carbamoyltransferase [Gammaproteobacteria bacterium]|nr:carbamoyltransferase [Gammaproteobacteria bacterium]
MLILGVNGGLDPVHEAHYAFDDNYVHDSAAVLLKDGEIVAGIEQERLDRIKHSNKFYTMSLRFCLDQAGVTLADIDCIAVYFTRPFFDRSLKYLHLVRPDTELLDTLTIYRRLFERELGEWPGAEKFRFVNHHLAHAMSAYAVSGFDESLVLAIDGAGEDISTLIGHAHGRQLDVLQTKPVPDSLGFFYLEVIRFLGYAVYDEYKVMGLAPYGDPAVHRERFKTFYTLLPEGDYHIHKERIFSLYDVLDPRERGAPFEQAHKDIAAALQEALETIVLHMLAHYRQAAGRDRLCLAGGVAQNSTMNGVILRSGLFRDVFVSPAAADAGCSFGAAFAVALELEPALRTRQPSPLEHVYWGRDIGDDASIRATLEAWKDFLRFERLSDTPAEVAQRLADGAVIGWVQGRSEFGPRALGNRSILADPRPAEHKEIINAMIKKREGYRPFAPSVLEERVDDFFEVPGPQKRFPFMSFVLPVREEWRQSLGAITHVDGSSRLQTVSRVCNPKYWELIAAFERLTGIPILLNTSFNNNAEPIVDSVEDAIVCFLTSGLHYLVAGDYFVAKREGSQERWLDLVATLPTAARLLQEDHYADASARRVDYTVLWNYKASRRQPLSEAAYRLLKTADGRLSVREAGAASGIDPTTLDALLDELLELWSQRFVILTPSPRR